MVGEKFEKQAYKKNFNILFEDFFENFRRVWWRSEVFSVFKSAKNFK